MTARLDSVVPGLLFAVAPAAIILNTAHGFFPFESVILGLGGYAALDALWRRDPTLPGPRELQGAWLAVLASGAVTLILAQQLSPFAGALKRLVVAWCGMTLVLRYAGPRLWAWFALSIPLTGAAVSVQLLRACLSRGFDVRKVLLFRTFFSDLGWGLSNYVGAVLSLCILGSLVLLALSRRPWLRVASGASLALMGLSMALLVSRGTVLAVGLGVAALALVTRGAGRWKILAVGAVGGLLLMRLSVFRVVLERFAVASQSSSYLARVGLWGDALDRFLRHPLLGVGLGQGRFQTDPLQFYDPHNYFLSVASETGVVGLIAWLALVWALYRAAGRAARLRPELRGWAAAAAVLVSVALFHACYEPTFSGTQYNFLFFWVYAVLLRAAWPLGEEGAAPAGAPRAPAPARYREAMPPGTLATS